MPEEILVKPGDLGNLRPEETMIFCTGSQGEPMAALTRIAYGDHQHVSVEASDTVIISAKPVPGNELRVHDTINRLTRAGALVLHQEIAPVHTSGHGNSDELRMILALLRPKNVMPVHGEFRMLVAHARLARESGVPDDRIVLAENGSVVELSDGVATIVDHVDTGRDVRGRPGSGGRARGVAPGPPPPVGGRRADRRRHGRGARTAARSPRPS